ncbi:MAG: YbhN family protein [Gaiellaceae bacterium]
MTKRRLIALAIGVAIAAATFIFVLPRIANYGDVWHVVQRLTWWQIAILLVATAINLATYALPWIVALPGLGFRRAFALTQASTATTYIAPGGATVGVAFSYAILRGWGFPAGAVSVAEAVTSIWNQFALLGFPVLALVLLGLLHESDPVLRVAAAVGLVLLLAAAGAFAAALSTPKVARAVGGLVTRAANWALRHLRRKPARFTPDSFVRFRDRAVGLLSRRWHMLTLATLAGQLSVFVLFLISLRVTHVSAAQVNGVEAFGAWSLARLVGSVPITPGGIGVVEVGLTTALVGFGGDDARVVAAVLLYRFLTIVPTLVVGLIAAATRGRLTPDLAKPV